MKKNITLSSVLLIMALAFASCTGKEQAKKLADLESAAAENQKIIAAMQADVENNKQDVKKMKELVTRIGETVLSLQNIVQAKHAASAKPAGKPTAKNSKIAAKKPGKPTKSHR